MQFFFFAMIVSNDIFRGGSSIKFSGGSVTSYFVLDNEDNVFISGVVYATTGYKKPRPFGAADDK